MRIKKNGKVITLTESDLNRIVKKVLSEQDETPQTKKVDGNFEITNARGKKSIIRVLSVQQTDKKTNKKYMTNQIFITNHKGKNQWVGNILMNGEMTKKDYENIFKQVDGWKYPSGGKDPNVENEIKSGIKNIIGQDIKVGM